MHYVKWKSASKNRLSQRSKVEIVLLLCCVVQISIRNCAHIHRNRPRPKTRWTMRKTKCFNRNWFDDGIKTKCQESTTNRRRRRWRQWTFAFRLTHFSRISVSFNKYTARNLVVFICQTKIKTKWIDANGTFFSVEKCTTQIFFHMHIVQWIFSLSVFTRFHFVQFKTEKPFK